VRNKDSHCQEIVVAYHDGTRQKQLVTSSIIPTQPLRKDSTNVEAVLMLARIVGDYCFGYSFTLELLGDGPIHEGSGRSLRFCTTSAKRQGTMSTTD